MSKDRNKMSIKYKFCNPEGIYFVSFETDKNDKNREVQSISSHQLGENNFSVIVSFSISEIKHQSTK